ncbi:T9SS type A sorting domain-containing protein [Flavobacterium sp. SUN046]|uniref:T9SS type A sorting domain-containing protein n=1 Tax=Flavobacterium sp. SUN046 TaxID=3002440 RepID=UPI002DB66E13|nr:T9SS type A sorting domain-containing protein [Flavobacterium sp. SUN046]MEC4049043.1 T9SS type A sorting domain-containing protein [Flavobacterium sp. SUN046]
MSIPLYSQTTVQGYLDLEQARLVKADSIESNINNYIETNLPTFTLSSQTLTAINNDLTTIHDCEDGPVTGSNAQLIINQIKRNLLRSNYFTIHPNLNAFYTSKIVPTSLSGTCINGGFENGNTANYTFRSILALPAAPPNDTPHLNYECNGGTIYGFYTPSLLPNQFQNQSTLVTSGNESFLSGLNININRVHTGGYALKLNPTPFNTTTLNEGNVTQVYQDFQVATNTIQFSYLQYGYIITSLNSAHRSPFFRYRLYKLDANGSIIGIIKEVCVDLKPGCKYSQVADNRFGTNSLVYTPNWVCEQINSSNLIGQNVRLEFTVSDCEFRNHFNTVYIDDLCGVICPPTWGSIHLNNNNIQCPTGPFNVCGNFQLAGSSTLSSMTLNILNSSGVVVGTLTNPTLTGQNFCFNVSPSNFGSNPLGIYNFQVVASTSNGCVPVLTDTMGTATFPTPITPTFAAVGSICSGSSLSALPTTSLNGITGTWSPAINNTATTTYTFIPTAGQCPMGTSTTMIITVNPLISPTFATVSPICIGSSMPPLPTTSLNGITGSWLPALNNTATTTYTFTPSAGQCVVANVVTMPIQVNPLLSPTFAQVAPICTGAILSPLPTTSLNGITGSWSPALSNTATTTYTFTPNGGQCVTSTVVTMTITVSAPPVITSISPSTQKVCINTSPIPVVVTVTGSPITYQWYSNSTNTTVGGTLIAGATMASYTPPTSEAKTKYYYVVVSKNGCSVTSSLVVVKVTNLISPQFFDLQSTVYCDTDFPISLPNTSENGIGGVWHVGTSSGAIVTTAATGGSYTFVPNAGQCAKSIAVTVSSQSLSMYTINNDYFTPGYPSTSLTTASVINNDQYLGNYLGGGFVPAGVSYYAQLVGAVPTFSSGGITMNSSGVFTIQAGTTGGVYTFHYVLQTDCGTTTQGEVTIVVQAYIQSYKMSFSFCYNSISSVQNNNGTGNSSLFNTTTIAGQPANSSNAIIEVQTPGGYPPFITVFADGTFAIAPGTPPSSVSFNIRVCSIGGVNCGDWVPCDIHIQTSVKGEADYLTYDTNGTLISPTGGAYNVLSNDSVIQCPNVLVPAVLGANANVLFTPIAPTNPIPFSLLASTGVVYLQSTGGDDLTEGDYLLPYMICDAQNPTHCITTGVWITVVAASPFTGTINSGQNEQYKHSNQPLISEKNGLQIINFPDPNLKARLLSGACCSDYPLNTTNIVDLNGDGEIDTSEALTIGAMNLSACNISNLTGLQYFTNLKNLWFPSNPISVLDYTVLPTGLEYLGPYNIPIQSINTSHFPNLINLKVNGTQISDLDFETNHAFNYLTIKDCPNISSVILKNGVIQDVSNATNSINGCWSNCPNLVTVCTDDNELAAVESFLTTCGYNLSLMNVNSSCVLGTEGFTNEGGFSVAPNPSKGVFELRFSESIEGSVSVYTILGQRIVYTELNGTVLGLQLSDYPSGSYMIVVESGDKVMRQMVVKE